MKSLHLLVSALISISFLMSACAGENPEAIDPIHYGERGDFEVGQRVASLSYQAPGSSGDRELEVVIWYPTRESTSLQPVFKTDDVWIDAPIAPEGNFPLAIFSHGTTVFADVGHPLTEHLASHGFVVMAPNHTGDTAQNLGEPRQTEMYLLRPSDISAVIDWAYALPEDDSLSGRITDDVVVTGHSMGGYSILAAAGATFSSDALDGCVTSTEAELCSNMTDENRSLFEAGLTDDRIDVLIPMAPRYADVLGPAGAGVGAIDIPVLLMTSSQDQRALNEVDGDAYWNSLTSPGSMRVNLETGGHHSFVITCEVFPAQGEGDGCGEGFINWQTAHTVMNTYALAFTRYHLFGDTGAEAILDGSESVAAEINLEHK